jgi:signal transduction histidine kinase
MPDSNRLIEELKKELKGDIHNVTFNPGDYIIKQGKESPVYIILSGVCKVFVYDKSGGEIFLSSLDRGNTIGDMSNFTKSKTVAYVVANTEVEVLKIETIRFNELLRGIPTYAQILYSQLCARLENTNESLTIKVNELLSLNENLNNKVEEQVSDIKEKNDRLKRQNNKLKEITKSRDKFLNIAVHDLRSPLSCIVGYLDLLNVMPGIQNDPDLQKMSKIMSRNCSGMFDLINDILDINKINNGDLEMNIEKVQISSVIHECFDTNMILCQKKTIDLVSDVSESIPACLADRRRVLEILNNLVGNAIKFSERDTQIKISAEYKTDSKYIWVKVSDQGQGIPPDEVPTLFQAFHQTSTVATEGEKGTGLGLAIVKKLVDLQKGEVKVKSELGAGSEFKFSIPVA